MKTNKLMKPIYYVEAYTLFTIFLYLFGPTLFEKINTLQFLFIIAIYHFSFYLGYKFEISRKTAIKSFINIESKKSIKRLKKLIIITLLITILSTITYTNIHLVDLGNIYDRLLLSIKNPLDAYNESFDNFNEGSYIYSLLVIASPITWFTFVLSIYYFKKLNLFYKVIVIFTFFIEVSRWIILGRNKGVFDIVFIFMAVFIIKVMQRDKFVKTKKLLNINKVLKLVFMLIILVLALMYFTNAISSRIDFELVYFYNNSIILNITPEIFKPTLIFLTSYLTQGYNAFSRIFGLDWTPMFGIGNSMFLMANFSEIFNQDFYLFTYQTKLMYETGIDSYSSWHSIYTWLANDFHWIGTIFIMYFIGKVFAFTVREAVVRKNEIAYPIFALFIMLFFYMPANNQVFSHPNTFVAFWVLLAILLFRKKINVVLF